jgi:phenylpropionate dioxygenase-like ring-hydroxylating dioxygenase large terminal subunit
MNLTHGQILARDGGRQRGTLPAWTYRSREFYERERREIFADTWQWICHVSDIPKPGDYISCDVAGEPLISLRGTDGEIRTFLNICPHRGSRLVDAPCGHAERHLRCPYHAWTFDLSGTVIAVPGTDRPSLLGRDLCVVETEIFLGFVFARLSGRGPGVAEMFGPWAQEVAAYSTEAMVPVGPITVRTFEADWKTVVANDLEGYHIGPCHPGLLSLVGNAYPLESRPDGMSRAECSLRDKPARQWSVRQYQRLLAAADWPREVDGRYRVYRAFPNWGFDCFPDQVMVTQILPIGPGRAVMRGSGYALPTTDRVKRAAQWLNWRCQNQVMEEDVRMTEGVQRGLASAYFDGGVLMPEEEAVRHFHDLVRARLPEAGGWTPPR